MMQISEPITVVNVMSSFYSGSTWLNLMLGSHSRSLSIGEFFRVIRNQTALCRMHGEDCPFWDQIELDFSDEADPFSIIARVAGKRYIIVNNSRNSLRFQRPPGISAKFIHLVRDGRAVVSSRLRKGRQATTLAAAKRWRKEVKRNQDLLKHQAASDQFHVNYEDLVADPTGHLQQICRFLGLDFEPAMLECWHNRHHFIGGNIGTLHSMARKGGGDQRVDAGQMTEKNVKDFNLAYYEQADPANFVDSRWKQELGLRQRLLFAATSGWLNRKLGYPCFL